MRARTVALFGVAAVVSGLVGGSSVATAAPASAHICIPVIWPCDDPEPEPSASPTPTPSAPGEEGEDAGGSSDAGETGADKGDDAGDDSGTKAGEKNDGADKDDTDKTTTRKWSFIGTDDSMVFTQPSAQLGSESLSFSGLKGIALVKLNLADGSQTTAIRLRADRITIKGFSLTVRAETGPKLVTTADTMTLRGNVNVYVNSLTATTPGGKSYTLGADTPPPADGVTPTLLRVTLGLVGSTADEISYSNTDQKMHE